MILPSGVAANALVIFGLTTGALAILPDLVAGFALLLLFSLLLVAFELARFSALRFFSSAEALAISRLIAAWSAACSLLSCLFLTARSFCSSLSRDFNWDTNWS